MSDANKEPEFRLIPGGELRFRICAKPGDTIREYATSYGEALQKQRRLQRMADLDAQAQALREEKPFRPESVKQIRIWMEEPHWYEVLPAVPVA